MKKVELYGPIKEEAGVLMVFAMLHKELGFPKLIPSSARGFDIDDIEYKNGKRVTLEFEFVSENFINHGHAEKMKDGRDYVIVCYEDNCKIIERVRKEFNKTNLELIELKNYIEIKKEKISENSGAIKYIVLNYNPYNADNTSIREWAKTNVYPINAKFKDDSIVPGSKILFKQGNYIVASCEVVKYQTFEKPKTENEWKLIQGMLSYPMGIFNLSLEELKETFGRGYIFYDEFYMIEGRRIAFKDVVQNKQMSHSGMIKISKEEYDALLGN